MLLTYLWNVSPKVHRVSWDSAWSRALSHDRLGTSESGLFWGFSIKDSAPCANTIIALDIWEMRFGREVSKLTPVFFPRRKKKHLRRMYLTCILDESLSTENSAATNGLVCPRSNQKTNWLKWKKVITHPAFRRVIPVSLPLILQSHFEWRSRHNYAQLSPPQRPTSWYCSLQCWSNTTVQSAFQTFPAPVNLP